MKTIPIEIEILWKGHDLTCGVTLIDLDYMTGTPNKLYSNGLLQSIHAEDTFMINYTILIIL